MPSIQIHSLPENFHLEPRGWSFAPLKNPELIDQIDIDWTTFHTVSMEPGTIRGNHFHPRVTEWLFFCGSPLLLAWRDDHSDRNQQMVIERNHTFVVIPPGVRHAVKNTGPGSLYLIAFRSPAQSSTDPEVISSILLD